MTDEHHRHAQLLTQGAQQLQNMRLVVTSRPVVAHPNQQLRLTRQCHGHGHALLLAAGELVRVALSMASRGQSHLPQQLDGTLAPLAAGQPGMQFQRLIELGIYLSASASRLTGVLRNQADTAAAQRLQRLRFERKEVLIMETDSAILYLRAGTQECHHGQRQGTFATAGLTDQSQRFTGRDRRLTLRSTLTSRPSALVYPRGSCRLQAWE